MYSTCQRAMPSVRDSDTTAPPTAPSASARQHAPLRERAMPPVSDPEQTVPLSTAPWSTAHSRLDVLSDTTTRLSLSCSAAPLVQSSPKHRHSPTQSFTYRHFDVRPSYAWSLVPAQSQTVDQTPLIGWGKSAPLQSRCELNVNLLGRPCGAGWSNKEYYAVDKFRVLAYNRDIPGIYQCCEMFQELMQVIPWIYQIHLPNV